MDEIALTLPADEAFHSVAHLVLGGLAARLDLTVETLEELEGDSGDALDLRRILRVVCDDFEVCDGDGMQWVEMTKRVQLRSDQR